MHRQTSTWLRFTIGWFTKHTGSESLGFGGIEVKGKCHWFTRGIQVTVPGRSNLALHWLITGGSLHQVNGHGRSTLQGSNWTKSWIRSDEILWRLRGPSVGGAPPGRSPFPRAWPPRACHPPKPRAYKIIFKKVSFIFDSPSYKYKITQIFQNYINVVKIRGFGKQTIQNNWSTYNWGYSHVWVVWG